MILLEVSALTFRSGRALIAESSRNFPEDMNSNMQMNGSMNLQDWQYSDLFDYPQQQNNVNAPPAPMYGMMPFNMGSMIMPAGTHQTNTQGGHQNVTASRAAQTAAPSAVQGSGAAHAAGHGGTDASMFVRQRAQTAVPDAANINQLLQPTLSEMHLGVQSLRSQ